jgi:hypothetical protein
MAGKTMELKELILSTLEELDVKIQEDGYEEPEVIKPIEAVNSDEKEFLLQSKERFEVLFDGLNSEANQKVEAKLNLVTNFLQFYISKIDERLDNIKHG